MPHTVSRCLAASLLVILALAGCTSNNNWYEDSGIPNTTPQEPAGSIQDVNRKMRGGPEQGRDADAAGGRTAPSSDVLVFMVAYDAEGRPVYVETRRGSGDPAFDRRAQEYVLHHKRFPKGRADNVLFSLKRGEVPKK